MKRIKYILILLISLITYIGCNKNSELEILTEEQQMLNKYKPELLRFLDLSSKKINATDKGDIISFKLLNEEDNYLFKDYNNDYSIVKITDDKVTYENLTAKRDFVAGKILNFSFEEKNKSINFKKVEVKNKLFLAKINDGCEGEFWLDVGLCTVSAAAISLSDGPLPFMDAVAVTYYTGCVVRATQVMDRCNGLEPYL